MSDIRSDSAERVLHIRPAPAAGQDGPGPSADVRALLSPLGQRVCETDNVYDSLARLLDPRGEHPRAVVVSLDCVGPAEMEFFSLVARLRPKVPVYVYGGARHRERIADAIRLGARGPITEDALRDLADEETPVTNRVGSSSESSDPLRPAGEDHVVVVTDESDNEHNDEDWSPEDAVDEGSGDLVDDEADDAPSTPIRVPWLRYDDRPTRTAPPRRDSSAASSRQSADGATGKTGRPDEPLLTEEELQALLGDDVAAIVPQSPAEFQSRAAGDSEEPK